MNIALVGLPGAGKSTFGRKLASALNLSFFDLDELIEQSQQSSITDIFKAHGEAQFRSIEHEQLLKFCSENDQYLLATGGGTPCFFDQMAYLNERALTLFLNVSLNTIVSRVNKNTNRPLLVQNADEKVRELYRKRLPYYQQAHLTLTDFDLQNEAFDQKLLAIKKAAKSRFQD